MTSWEEQGKEHVELNNSREFSCPLETRKSWRPRWLYKLSLFSFRNTELTEVTWDRHTNFWWKHYVQFGRSGRAHEEKLVHTQKHYILKNLLTYVCPTTLELLPFLIIPLKKAEKHCPSRCKAFSLCFSTQLLPAVLLWSWLSPCPSSRTLTVRQLQTPTAT